MERFVINRIYALILLLFFTQSCATLFQVPTSTSVPERDVAEKAWARVLSTNVDSEGRVNFRAVGASIRDLETYVAYLASESPMTHAGKFAMADEKMAYYLNSYNALAMYGVIRAEYPHDFEGFFAKLRFFKLKEYILGGEAMSLYDYENNIIRKVGDPRVHFALNCMSVGCPRLPQKPFDAKILNQQLDAGAREFFGKAKYLQVDNVAQSIQVSEILKFFPNDFVNERIAPSIPEFISKYRQPAIPVSYAVNYMKYDWTVNKQP